ncbi:MAG: hypothetical protein CMG00_05310 [Candidatus Marinimicrobia bacterium]|nr:hypothetical protein [Candidatus Neomarinimicrobiota bacterium]
MDRNVKSKFKIIWSMRSWSFKYIDWRMTTAYPSGWRHIVRHPLQFLKDFYNYLSWCQEIDKDVDI